MTSDGETSGSDDLPLVVPGFARRFDEEVDPGVHAYFAGGAANEVTLRANVGAWQQLDLWPRVLAGVAERDLSVDVLGRRRPHPVLCAPAAFHGLLHPDGELASLRGAAAAGSTFCLSTLGSVGPDRVGALAADLGAPWWMQVYVFRDRGVSDAVVDAAVAAGAEALVLTVDMPVLGRRERDVTAGFVVGGDTPVPALAAAGVTEARTMAEVWELLDPGLTWDDLEALVERSPVPVLAKGVLRPDDARHAVDVGAAGVVVSNHGGRQLDTSPSTAVALPGVVEAVDGAADVLVDGGIRRGTDVAKALALGARAVGVGRPYLWGLAVGGAEGVQRVLELLAAELDTALALLGEPAAGRLHPGILEPSPAPPEPS